VRHEDASFYGHGNSRQHADRPDHEADSPGRLLAWRLAAFNHYECWICNSEIGITRLTEIDRALHVFEPTRMVRFGPRAFLKGQGGSR
jgi:hypothetical protein